MQGRGWRPWRGPGSLGHRRQPHGRAEPRTAPAPGRPAVAGSRVPRAAKASSSSHGRDLGTFPLPPPLGLEGFAFHMAPGWGRWAQGTGCRCSHSRSGGPGEPGLPQNPTSRRGWQQQHLGGALAGAPTARRGRPPSHTPHLPCLPPSPLALPVGGRGRGAKRVIPGELEGGGEGISYPRY